MELRRILVIHSGAIGDFVLALPALGALRRRFTSAQIELLGNPAIHVLAENRFYVDQVTPMETRPLHHLFAGALPADLYEYLSSFDLIVSWFGRGDETYTRTLARIPRRTIIEKPFPPDASRVHVVEHLLGTLAPLGIEAGDHAPRLYLSERDRVHAAQLFRKLEIEDKSVAAVHPGSGSARKCWPAERFAELAQIFLAHELPVLIIEGPADGQAAEQLFARLPESRRLFRLANRPLVELTAALERCSVYVGNDSGITHLAAAVGAPTVAIFRVTDPAVWGPRGNVAILESAQSAEIVVQAIRKVNQTLFHRKDAKAAMSFAPSR
jgi:ADP-heptose:LPS heptosyltransferase